MINKECDCGEEMVLEDQEEPFNDPTDYYGVGIRTWQCWVCPDCDNDEPYEPEDETDPDAAYEEERDNLFIY